MNGNLIGFFTLGLLGMIQICFVAFWCGKVTQAITGIHKDIKNIREDAKDTNQRLDIHINKG